MASSATILRPQVARDALGGERLGDVLEVSEEEDAGRYRQELDDQRTEDEALRVERVDRPSDQLRDDEVQAVGGDGQRDDRPRSAASRGRAGQ